MKLSSSSLPQISEYIHTIRGHKVILDSDLAKLYGVTTKVLNQAVKRNAGRFPSLFLFQLNPVEVQNLRSQFVTSSLHGGRRFIPFAFTEHGALMASNVLKSKQAIRMSVHIIEAFIQMRHLLLSHETFTQRLAEIDKTLLSHDQALGNLYQKLVPLLTPPSLPPKRKIGFH